MLQAGCNDDTSLAASLIENYRTSTLPGLERIYWKSTRTGIPLIDIPTGDLTTYGEIFTGKPALPASCCLVMCRNGLVQVEQHLVLRLAELSLPAVDLHAAAGVRRVAMTAGLVQLELHACKAASTM